MLTRLKPLITGIVGVVSILTFQVSDAANTFRVKDAECNYIKSYSVAAKTAIPCSIDTMPPLSLMAYVKQEKIPVYYLFVEQEANSFSLPPLILLSIIQHESGKTCMVKKNSDGTYDLGKAQINTIHAEELVKKRGISLDTVACDDRTNALVAAWHLRNKVDELYARGEEDIWAAVGRYHDKRKKFANPYILKVKAAYIRLLNKHS
jgi:hypothetical protein